MFPWDFGIINVLNEESKFKIIPYDTPKGMIRGPCLLFELKSMMQHKNFTTKAEFTLTVVEGTERNGSSAEIMKEINRVINADLVLHQSEEEIGTARVKIESVENKKNTFLLNLVAIILLKPIYEDEL